MSDDLVKRLRSVLGYKDLGICPEAADRIEELEAENKNLRHMIIDQIEGAGDDPEIMAASRAEWAARAKAAEAKLAKARKFIRRFACQTRKIDHIGPEEWPLTELDLSVQRDRDITTARALLAELTGGNDDQ
jgi:hypothetical protein